MQEKKLKMLAGRIIPKKQLKIEVEVLLVGDACG